MPLIDRDESTFPTISSCTSCTHMHRVYDWLVTATSSEMEIVLDTSRREQLQININMNEIWTTTKQIRAKTTLTSFEHGNLSGHPNTELKIWRCVKWHNEQHETHHKSARTHLLRNLKQLCSTYQKYGDKSGTRKNIYYIPFQLWRWKYSSISYSIYTVAPCYLHANSLSCNH